MKTQNHSIAMFAAVALVLGTGSFFAGWAQECPARCDSADNDFYDVYYFYSPVSNLGKKIIARPQGADVSSCFVTGQQVYYNCTDGEVGACTEVGVLNRAASADLGSWTGGYTVFNICAGCP